MVKKLRFIRKDGSVKTLLVGKVLARSAPAGEEAAFVLAWRASKKRGRKPRSAPFIALANQAGQLHAITQADYERPTDLAALQAYRFIAASHPDDPAQHFDQLFTFKWREALDAASVRLLGGIGSMFWIRSDEDLEYALQLLKHHSCIVLAANMNNRPPGLKLGRAGDKNVLVDNNSLPVHVTDHHEWFDLAGVETGPPF